MHAATTTDVAQMLKHADCQPSAMPQPGTSNVSHLRLKRMAAQQGAEMTEHSCALVWTVAADACVEIAYLTFCMPLQNLEALFVCTSPSPVTKRLVVRFEPQQQLRQLKQQLIEQALPAVLQVRDAGHRVDCHGVDFQTDCLI